MYKLTRSRLLIILLSLSVVLAYFTGCGEDTDEDGNGGTPELPPDSSMTMDLSAFGQGKLEAPNLNALSEQTNFNTAVVTASLVNTAVITGLAIPVSLFTLAKTVEPVEQDDGSWLWSYSKTILTKTFTANLTGKEEGDKTVWSMKVSSDAALLPLDNFEWYTGTSANDNKSGSWQFFAPTTPDQANPAFAIEWKAEIGLKGIKSEATFTNQKAEGERAGDVLTYSVEGKMASMSYYDKDKDTTAIIEWDLETNAGSITAPFYNNGEKACWNENKQNVACE